MQSQVGFLSKRSLGYPLPMDSFKSCLAYVRRVVFFPALVVVGLEGTGGSGGTSSSSGHLSEDAKVVGTFVGKECVQNFKSKNMIADKNTEY